MELRVPVLADADNAVVLSSYREEEVWRLQRLAKTLAGCYLRGFAVAHPLIGLHDHKGVLTATYSEAPSEDFKRTVEEAWQNEGESADQVEHVVATTLP
jgi:hypothetical protein